MLKDPKVEVTRSGFYKITRFPVNPSLRLQSEVKNPSCYLWILLHGTDFRSRPSINDASKLAVDSGRGSCFPYASFPEPINRMVLDYIHSWLHLTCSCAQSPTFMQYFSCLQKWAISEKNLLFTFLYVLFILNVLQIGGKYLSGHFNLGPEKSRLCYRNEFIS